MFVALEENSVMPRGPAPDADRERNRFGLRLTESERDRIIADWIDDQINRGFDVSQQIKDILYQLITGRSVINNQPLGIYSIGRSSDLDEKQPWYSPGVNRNAFSTKGISGAYNDVTTLMKNAS